MRRSFGKLKSPNTVRKKLNVAAVSHVRYGRRMIYLLNLILRVIQDKGRADNPELPYAVFVKLNSKLL